MKTIKNIELKDVQAVYSGPEGDLWELIMGEQIHIGGFQSSMDLAKRAGIGAGHAGRGPVLLQRRRDALPGEVLRRAVHARRGCHRQGRRARPPALPGGGLDEQISFTLANVCASGLPAASADFVWGEDAWCYVVDKAELIAEAARLVKPGGLIAFTDWVEGPPDCPSPRRSGTWPS